MAGAEVVLLTGAAGAVGRPLLSALAARPEVDRIYALVHVDEVAPPDRKVTIVRGDVTAGTDLGLDAVKAGRLAAEVTAIVHAAADTSFALTYAASAQTNLHGTRNVMAFASRCPRLDRFLALSTTHVAGRRTGLVLETELEHDHGFVNGYEQAKYEMEIALRSTMADLPISVCRLSTVAGDSMSGAISRRGALHQAVLLLYKSLAPMLPGGEDSPVDLIASDYAADAVAHLATRGFAAGRTWQVCGGPETLGAGELLDLTMETLIACRPSWRLRAIVRPVLVDLETFELFHRSVEEIGDPGSGALVASLAVVSRFAPQLAFPKRYDDRCCQAALAGSGITRPPLRDVWRRVVARLVEPCPT